MADGNIFTKLLLFIIQSFARAAPGLQTAIFRDSTDTFQDMKSVRGCLMEMIAVGFF